MNLNRKCLKNMVYKIEILAPVFSDVNDFILYFKKISEGLAERFYSEYLSLLELLEKNPTYYTFISESLRRIPFTNFPYSVVYKIDEGFVVTIISVVSQRRNPDFNFSTFSRK